MEEPKRLTILAPAKINLYLDVKEKREDGYHNIETIMQTVGVFDRLQTEVFAFRGESEISVTCGDMPDLDGEKNIVYKAAKAFFKAVDKKDYNVRFYIEKRIPTEAGLGGGSTDAAAALVALNLLYETALSRDDLCKIGTGVGADVPFCIKKGTVSAEGIGEIMESCTPMPYCTIVIAVPYREKINTKEAYQRIDTLTCGHPGSYEKAKEALKTCDISCLSNAMYNIFESVLDPSTKVFELKEMLMSYGAKAAQMSGSGSAVFGLFEDTAAAKKAKEALSKTADTYICHPVRRDYAFIEN